MAKLKEKEEVIATLGPSLGAEKDGSMQGHNPLCYSVFHRVFHFQYVTVNVSSHILVDACRVLHMCRMKLGNLNQVDRRRDSYI